MMGIDSFGIAAGKIRTGISKLFTATLCETYPSSVGAESGAVLAIGQNLEVLAALVGILTPEQKAAFLALLTAPKPGA